MGKSVRSWIKIKLEAPHPIDPERSRGEVWADLLIDQAESGGRDMLDVLKFTEGNTPPPEPPPSNTGNRGEYSYGDDSDRDQAALLAQGQQPPLDGPEGGDAPA